MKYIVKIVLYHFFLKEFVAYCVANQVALGLRDAQILALQTMLAEWLNLMNAYTNPLTFGPASASVFRADYLVAFRDLTSFCATL